MMTTIHSSITVAIGSACLVAGCCSNLPVVPHAIRCDAFPVLLVGKCEAPTQIPDDATFSILVDAMQGDRKALQECALAAEALRASMERCNQGTDDFNKKMDEINEKLRKAAR